MSLHMLAAAIVVCAAFHPLAAASAEAGRPILKKAKERGALSETKVVHDSTASTGAAAKQQRLSLCLKSWDAQTHMSVRDWRIACERSVRDYPSAFR